MRSAITLSMTLFLVPFFAYADENRYRDFDDDHLIFGKKVWIETCEGCHGWGIGGAPIPLHFDQWESRIAKGKDTLYEHAINGFFGPDDSMMPERGGNPELSDEEVRAAVDYMVELAISHK